MRLLGGDVDVGVDVLLQLGLAVLIAVVYRDTDNVVAMATFLIDKTSVENIYFVLFNARTCSLLNLHRFMLYVLIFSQSKCANLTDCKSYHHLTSIKFTKLHQSSYL